MQKHIEILIKLLQKNDLKTLREHYLNSSETENIAQLGFLFQQGQIKLSSYAFYQELATSLITHKGFPFALIDKIKTQDTLNFFTPALQVEDNFNKIDDQQRNVLHYLFINNQLAADSAQPPFNYLRSMMLFESNEALRDALCQRDQQNLTPIEAYLFANKNFTPLANHELTALLALIEIESKQQEVEQTHYPLCIQSVSKICREQAMLINQELQHVMLIATYYTTPIKQVVNDINILTQ